MRKIAWPLSILFSSLLAALIVFVFPGLMLRPVLIMAFLFICPGATLTRFLQIKDIAIEWMLALALSCSLDACVAGIQLYAGKWSPTETFSIILGFCVVGAILQIVTLASSSAVHPRWTRIVGSTTSVTYTPIVLTLVLGSLTGIGFWLCLVAMGLHV